MHIQILGTRGIPSLHGGFETFAHDLAIFLTERGHKVTVYCQADDCDVWHEDNWFGVRRVFIPAPSGTRGTISFDLKSALHASREDGLALTLGYNTAIFSLLYRLVGHRSIMNMDGLEWKRQKWSPPARAWLRLNEWLGARLSNHLVADHPSIAEHLSSHTATSKITMIPYGSHGVDDRDDSILQRFGLERGNYYLLIARPEPENSILEIVSSYSAEKRKIPLVVLGKYSVDNAYHAEVISQAGEGVKFVGPVYDRAAVASLRIHATAYIHGHQVGGTNPSLVESLAAANPIIAHDNIFTRWVTGDSAMFFNDTDSLRLIFTDLDSTHAMLSPLREASRSRFQQMFCQQAILLQYETLMERFYKNVYASEPKFSIDASSSIVSTIRVD